MLHNISAASNPIREENESPNENTSSPGLNKWSVCFGLIVVTERNGDVLTPVRSSSPLLRRLCELIYAKRPTY